MISFIGTRLACNVVIYLTASARLPEFKGYQPRTFPGQPSPRTLPPQPRRPSYLASSENKKIKPKPRFGYDSVNITSRETIEETRMEMPTISC